MNIKTCPRCEAKWIDGQLYWSTGKEGCPHDLAGLVCNASNFDECINPCKGSTSRQTWEQRAAFLDKLGDLGLPKDDDTPNH